MVLGLTRPQPKSRPTRAYRHAVMLTATLCFALNYTAWSLVRPLGLDPWHFFDGSLRADLLLLAAPAVLGALGRIPVGALTDRFGPRIVFPAVAATAAFVLLVLAVADSRPVAVGAACALAVAGTAFPVGASLVASLYPFGQRGVALSVYGAGMGGAGAANLASLQMLSDYGTGELAVLAAALLGCAVLIAVVVRVEHPAPPRRKYALRTAAALVRLPATRYLAAWWALTLGGTASFSLFLPSYLHGVYGVSLTTALLSTAAAVAVVAAACPVGGWLCGRRDPAAVLALGYGTVAGMALLVVFELPKGLTIALVVAIAAGLGLAGGVILALIGRTAPAGRMGIISGTVGAAGGLAVLLGPMLLGAAFERTGSYSVGWAILAGFALAVAAHIRGQRGYIGVALAFPAAPAATGRHPTTVVSLAAADAARNTEGVVAALAALATSGDLAIVYGHQGPPGTGLPPYALVNGLRTQLPGRTVMAVYLGHGLLARDAVLVAEVLDEGGIVLGYAPDANLVALAVRLADRVGAHQVLRLTDRTIDATRPLTLPWYGLPRTA